MKLNSRYYDKLRNKKHNKGLIFYTIFNSILKKKKKNSTVTRQILIIYAILPKLFKDDEEPLIVTYFTTHSIYELLYDMLWMDRFAFTIIMFVLYLILLSFLIDWFDIGILNYFYFGLLLLIYLFMQIPFSELHYSDQQESFKHQR